jgi:rRNA maturation RNase YbeY
VAIKFFTENISFKLSDKKKIKNWIKFVIENYKYSVGEINFIFTSEEQILEINLRYLNHDYYTDIITFPYSEGNLLSADIYISIPTVRTNAQSYNESFSTELNRVMVHGVLHLIGFEDTTESERNNMRTEENQWLNVLNSNY